MYMYNNATTKFHRKYCFGKNDSPSISQKLFAFTKHYVQHDIYRRTFLLLFWFRQTQFTRPTSYCSKVIIFFFCLYLYIFLVVSGLQISLLHFCVQFFPTILRLINMMPNFLKKKQKTTYILMLPFSGIQLKVRNYESNSLRHIVPFV
jgi:hypothetical protein